MKVRGWRREWKIICLMFPIKPSYFFIINLRPPSSVLATHLLRTCVPKWLCPQADASIARRSGWLLALPFGGTACMVSILSSLPTKICFPQRKPKSETLLKIGKGNKEPPLLLLSSWHPGEPPSLKVFEGALKISFSDRFKRTLCTQASCLYRFTGSNCYCSLSSRTKKAG